MLASLPLVFGGVTVVMIVKGVGTGVTVGTGVGVADLTGVGVGTGVVFTVGAGVLTGVGRGGGGGVAGLAVGGGVTTTVGLGLGVTLPMTERLLALAYATTTGVLTGSWVAGVLGGGATMALATRAETMMSARNP